MKTVFLLAISTVLIVSGCSSQSSKTAKAGAQGTDNKPAVVYDTKKPTTYEEYKKWRAANDPASEAYAEYKEWEINQRKWQLEKERSQ